MDPAALRVRTNQLAEDLAWLEGHVATKPDSTLTRGRLRLAAAMVRNVVAPYLDNQPPLPLHIAVVGGGAGGVDSPLPPPPQAVNTKVMARHAVVAVRLKNSLSSFMCLSLRRSGG